MAIMLIDHPFFSRNETLNYDQISSTRNQSVAERPFLLK